MSSGRALRIGTRGSRLAMWQADHVAGRLRALGGAPAIEIVEIRTQGDNIVDVPLSQVPGKAFFTKEIEEALLDGRVDLAVHSLKDLETVMPEGLAIGAVLEREDPRDALVSAEGAGIDALPPGARVGTSSLRRRALLARRRPDVELVELRGNVPTRVERVNRGELDAVILAAAGLHRLDLAGRISDYLSIDAWPPAVAQGAIAVQLRGDDSWTKSWAERLDHPATRVATRAERALLRRLEGGCQVPLGAIAIVEGEELELAATVCSLDGTETVDGARRGPAAAPEELGVKLADDIRRHGGAEILAKIRDEAERRGRT